jgi:hypothetical protein
MTKSKSVDRKCSYCSKEGHTITTCQTRKNHLDEAEQINAKAREEIISLFKQAGLSLGALIELKHRDFKKIENIEDPEDGAITELFTISKIRWISVNKSMIDQHIKIGIKDYIRNHGAMKENYANVVLVNPNYPDGYTMTVTAEKIKRLLQLEKPFPSKDSVIGDFYIHDNGDWEETIKSIPKDFFKGKFFTPSFKPIK